MSVQSTWTGPDLAALLPLIDAMISAALTGTMQTFAAASGAAYSGTRFQATFAVRPQPILTEATLFNSDPIFAFVEEPTRPHDIFPRTARALRWIGPDGKPRFATHVHHPGTAGKQRIPPLFDAASADLGARLSAGWERLQP